MNIGNYHFLYNRLMEIQQHNMVNPEQLNSYLGYQVSCGVPVVYADFIRNVLLGMGWEEPIIAQRAVRVIALLTPVNDIRDILAVPENYRRDIYNFIEAPYVIDTDRELIELSSLFLRLGSKENSYRERANEVMKRDWHNSFKATELNGKANHYKKLMTDVGIKIRQQFDIRASYFR